MSFTANIMSMEPLTVLFAHFNCRDNSEPFYIPRLLWPVGYFIRWVLTNDAGQVLFESRRPKIHLKLHPEREESYLLLEPGYSYGAVFNIEVPKLRLGSYNLGLYYSNLPFTGAKHFYIGEVNYETVLSFHVRGIDDVGPNDSSIGDRGNPLAPQPVWQKK